MQSSGHEDKQRAMKALRAALAGLASLLVLVLCSGAAAQAQGRRADRASQRFSPQMLDKIEALREEKRARTATQQKIDPQLLYSDRMRRGRPVARGIDRLKTGVKLDPAGRSIVEIKARVTPAVLERLEAIGAEVLDQSPRFDMIRARVPLRRIGELASLEDVRSVRRQLHPMTHKLNTTQGDVAHLADQLRSSFGVDGTGITIGVLSDGVDSLAARQATGDLPSTVTVLTGQAGTGDEGTAMLEIVYDIAPGADLMFATAFNGVGSFANNILALEQAGCDVIIDDVFYVTEGVFQDDNVAVSVNTVTAAGALYFSSAGNSGHLSAGTSGVWEGDWVDSGSEVGGDAAHDFGGGIIGNILTQDNDFFYTLQWSDELGASRNDYDLLLTDPTFTTIEAASTFAQNGNDDPFEYIDSITTNHQGLALVIVKFRGKARYLHLNTHRGRLTFGTNGQLSGHAAASDAFGIAAVYSGYAPFDSGDTIEPYSSDGPRRIFYDPAGNAHTPGDFLATGGVVRNKPDLTAIDCVSTSTPGFTSFCGTSAAAPHAGAIAALLLELDPNATPADIRSALTSSAIDIAAAGVDHDSGAGIIDALAAAEVLVCGNGMLEGTEECDDGNLQDGDCCSSVCRFEPVETECRAANDACDAAEFCTGTSGTCPVDDFTPALTECRAAVDVCDTSEVCDGLSAACPTDGVEPASTVCRAAAGACDEVELCDGVSTACTAPDLKLGTECRAAAGICDVAEICDGVSNDCPTDDFAPASTLCRTSVDVCDLAEVCDGLSAACPIDSVAPAATECRAAAGECDAADLCDGVATACPADAKLTDECRTAVDVCDVAESCDGVADTCPVDGFAAVGTECRAPAGECDAVDV